MVRKNAAFEEKGAAMGHNKPSQEEQFKITLAVNKLMMEKQKIDDQIKAKLNAAKDAGHLKTPIRKVAAEMLKAAESLQAKREVDRETDRLRHFVANKDGQYDFLIETVDQEPRNDAA